MDFPRYLAWTRADGDRLAAAAELGMTAPVPSCPGWTVADLVAHTGVVHRHKAQIIGEGWQDDMPEPEDPPENDVISWYREGLDEMLDVLAAHDPAEPIATWLPEDQTVGFWYRRMACETVVHRIDAELAHGVVTPVDANLAADGIDEILTVMMTGYPDWADFRPLDRAIRIETIDTGDRWTLQTGLFSGTSPNTGTTFGDEPTYILDGAADPNTVIAGEAEDVLLFLWGRRPHDGLVVRGDPEDLERLRTVAADSTQ
jgi:uncharacterized protein (TIGR03083 family)